ncbi:hypothetical protein GTY87_40020 [Streptomyces sp. SID7813]|uniref:Uncharacterized protein n=1 Tax=Streptomyces coelicolor (strain ATCC BAA-471 / A3(2) / M145) TaxID=100226 RepID=Q9S1Y6_STRCO|nr:hypothetical protein [Streptomyces sp. SID7813]QFI40353.1 hypothetical protein FQ762_00040 [Streptomyces coelicolor A3(2)]MYU47328.1 hypothetical protein [Streptomyces sp. SID7813]QFI47528.1 hypothetical protein FQ762_40430 [Streptomyces coelicolor A3(2)]CAB53298.1 hypothetical protein [Streptomyces coelicolor A3(2)]
MACVGEEDAEWVVRVACQAGQSEAVGDEGEGLAGVAVWPVREGGECAGEGDGFRVDHQVAGHQGGGGAARGGQAGVGRAEPGQAGVPAVGEMLLVVVPAGGDSARGGPGGEGAWVP